MKKSLSLLMLCLGMALGCAGDPEQGASSPSGLDAESVQEEAHRAAVCPTAFCRVNSECAVACPGATNPRCLPNRTCAYD